MQEEKNTLTLRGGLAEGWQSHDYPQRVELPLGFALRRLHVLGGIAAWGYPYTGERAPAVKLTWVYADGQREERVLVDGTEFADWIGRHEVPGSTWVDLLAEDSWGQARTFHVDPARSDVVVDTLVLESFDNHLAPTFLALTAELGSASPLGPPGSSPASSSSSAAAAAPPPLLLFGGGSSHDYPRWFDQEARATLATLDLPLAYTDSPAELARALDSLSVLILSNNQPLPDPALRARLLDFVARGGGLVLLHAATWYNWPDWPEYNRVLVGGGTRSHESYGEFAVRVTAEHPVTAGVPRSFSVRDELYRFEPDPEAGSEVLAVGTSLTSGAEFPVLWTRTHGQGRLVALTLGHDGAAHEHAAFRTLLQNAVRWVRR